MTKPTGDKASGITREELLEGYRLSVESAPIGLALLALDGSWRYVNPALCRMLGGQPEDFVGKTYQDFTHPEDLARDLALVADLIAGRTSSLLFEKRYVRLDGEVIHAKLRAVLATESEGSPRYFVSQIEDLTEQKRQARAVEHANARFAALVENSSDVLSISDGDGRIIYASPACTDAYGRKADELVGTRFGDIIHPDDYGMVVEHIGRLKRGETRQVTFTHRQHHPDLGWRYFEATLTNHLDNPAVRGLVSNARDVTDRIETAERLAHQATHDPLTGLPNRALFLDKLERSVSAMNHADRSAVLFIDLDWFKGINDTLGHSIGDEVLITVAERMRAVLRPGDSLARLGGDEFVVLAKGLDGPEPAAALAEQLRAAIVAPMRAGGQRVCISCSVGIAFSSAGHGPEMLMQDADLAMYLAKELGRNRTEIYRESMRARAIGRLATEQAIRQALASGGVEVVYQPIVNLQTGLLICAESLARIRDADGQLLGAEQFIPVAEETGLIVQLGEVVLHMACGQQKAWERAGFPTNGVTVNVSARQLDAPDFVDRLSTIIHRHSLDPSHLCLEVTESTLIEGSSVANRNVHAVKDTGVSLALDDFGTGWASLAHLRRFPFDAIKIDRSFVGGLGTDHGDTEVVKAIVGLSRSLGLRVIAEGVETVQQEELLRSFGCGYAQGYLYSKPLPAAEFEGLTQLLTR
jgi:diguanylate cyclase (GGDEF)-like protein/PAS domain S-box-containing protein